MAEPTTPMSETAREARVAGAFRSSMSWNVANMGISQIITMMVFVFLTYRLDPVIFGVFALGVIVVDYFNYQAQSASVDAIVQSQDFSPTALSTAFWCALGVYSVVALVLFASGGALANLMDAPKLEMVLPALALTLLALPFAIPCSATLLRDHDFKGVALRGILGSVLGGLAALVTAFSPFPEWALVAQRGAYVVTVAVFLMLRARWLPSLKFAADTAKSFLSNASRIFFAQGLGMSHMRILDLIVGLSFGAAAVGLMRIASRFTDAMYGTFASPIGSLWVILLSEEGQSADSKASLLIRLTQMSALICLPVFAGIAVTSADLVELALDDAYAASAPMLTVFCLAGLTIPFSYFRNHALTALRKLNLLSGLSVIDVTVVLIAALALSRFSVEAIVAAIVIMQVVRGVIAAPVLMSALNVRWSQFLGAAVPAYMAILAMAAAVYGVGTLIGDLAVFWRLSIKVSVGALVYVGYLMAFHRQWSMTALSMLKRDKAAA